MGAFRRFVYMPEYDLWADKICTVYCADPVRQLGDPIEEGHTDHLVPAALVENPGDRAFILNYLEQAGL